MPRKHTSGSFLSQQPPQLPLQSDTRKPLTATFTMSDQNKGVLGGATDTVGGAAKGLTDTAGNTGIPSETNSLIRKLMQD